MTETLRCPVDECETVIQADSHGTARTHLLIHAFRTHYQDRSLAEVDRDLRRADA